MRAPDPGLREARAACRAGDTLVVTKLDRLARSLPDARDIVGELTERGVRLSIGGSVRDPADPVGRLLFNVRAMVAEFEAALGSRAHARGDGRGACQGSSAGQVAEGQSAPRGASDRVACDGRAHGWLAHRDGGVEDPVGAFTSETLEQAHSHTLHHTSGRL